MNRNALAKPLGDFYFSKTNSGLYVHRNHYATDEDALTAAAVVRHIFGGKTTILRQLSRRARLTSVLERCAQIQHE